MTHDFIYHNPTKVYFGNGMLAHLPEEISRLGSRVLLITGGSSAKKSGLFDKVLAEISKASKVLPVPAFPVNPISFTSGSFSTSKAKLCSALRG